MREFTDIIYFFIRRVWNVKLGIPFTFKKIKSSEHIHQICCEALTIFDKFPFNYIKWLAEIVKIRNASTRKPIRGYFHLYHPNLTSKLPLRFREFLYKAFTEHITEFLEKNSKPYYFKGFEGLTTELNLAEQLGVEIVIISNLVKSKDIIVSKTECTKNKRKIFFDGDTFLKIMNQIRSNLVIQNDISKNSLMNLTQIKDHFSADNNRLSKFLSLILRRNVKPYYEDLDANGLHRFLFRKQDIYRDLKQ